MFTGNPGTGKTTVARLLSQILRALGIVSKGHLVETDRSQLVAGYVGQTAARTRAAMESALGGTLLIDEAYALARGSEQDFGREAIDTIVKFMEDHRDDLAVIAAGYPEEMQTLIDANPGLQSRFTRAIHFPDYTTAELVGHLPVDERREPLPPRRRRGTQADRADRRRAPHTRVRQRSLRAQRVRGRRRPPGRSSHCRRRPDRRAADDADRRRHRGLTMVTPDDIEQAWGRIGPYIRVTPVLSLDAGELGVPVPTVLKLELLQHTGSFKPRGAFHRVLTADIPPAGLIAASGGNHGAAVAHVARQLGLRAEVFVPSTSPEMKRDRIAALGADVHVIDGFYDDAQRAADERAEVTGAYAVHPYDSPFVVAGQGTVARELEQQVDGLDTLVVATGGGGFIAGQAAWFAGRVRCRQRRADDEPVPAGGVGRRRANARRGGRAGQRFPRRGTARCRAVGRRPALRARRRRRRRRCHP